MNSDSVTVSVSRRFVALGTIAFTLLALVVIRAGLAYPLQKTEWSKWPWNQNWFVFYKGAPHLYLLRASGVTRSGQKVSIELDRYFRFPVAFQSRRYNEFSRTPYQLERLAAFVCDQVNAERTVDPLVRISVWDSWYSNLPGKRRKIDEVLGTELNEKLYLDNRACSEIAWKV